MLLGHRGLDRYGKIVSAAKTREGSGPFFNILFCLLLFARSSQFAVTQTVLMFNSSLLLLFQFAVTQTVLILQQFAVAQTVLIFIKSDVLNLVNFFVN